MEVFVCFLFLHRFYCFQSRRLCAICPSKNVFAFLHCQFRLVFQRRHAEWAGNVRIKIGCRLMAFYVFFCSPSSASVGFALPFSYYILSSPSFVSLLVSLLFCQKLRRPRRRLMLVLITKQEIGSASFPRIIRSDNCQINQSRFDINRLTIILFEGREKGRGTVLLDVCTDL